MTYHPYPISLRRTPSLAQLRKTEVPVSAQTRSSTTDVEMSSQSDNASNGAPKDATPTAAAPAEPKTRTLAEILDGPINDDSLGDDAPDTQGMDEDEAETEAKEGYCVECEGKFSLVPRNAVASLFIFLPA